MPYSIFTIPIVFQGQEAKIIKLFFYLFIMRRQDYPAASGSSGQRCLYNYFTLALSTHGILPKT